MPTAQAQKIHWGKPVEAVRCEGANSEALDFSAVPSGKGIVFTSNRDLDKNNRFDETEKMYCTDLWYADRLDFGKYQMPARLAGKVNTKSHEGVASLHADAKQMVFSASSEETCDLATGKARLKIKSSQLAAGSADWQKPVELSFNQPNSAACHPTLSADGKWMVFASDRAGSLGGMDLWATQQAADGSWSLPVNLGEGVNTSSHEIFPFLGPDGQLYFSSKGHGGEGGLDIFVSARDVSGAFGKPRNLSAPFNSAADDFGFYLNKNLLSGWFSSNRTENMGDELWEWRAPARPTTVALAGLVREKGGPALANQKVILRNKATGEVLKTWTTDKTGEFSLPEIPCDADFEIVVNPDAPPTERRDISTKGLCDLDEPKLEKVIIELPVRVTSVPGLAGIVREKPSGRAIADAKVILRNKKTGQIVQTLTSDKLGNFKIPTLDCDTDYELVVNPDGPNTERRDITTRGLCAPGIKPAEMKEIFELEAPKKDLVIRLDKLYYDYDKSNVRPDAAVELDKVVSFMRQYPSMVVELSSHTDSRGSDSYNLNLSQRRAGEARQYILSKGIEATRISAVGRGETQLSNHCKNGVKCSDPEHEANRRTEVRVVSFSEAGVKIEN